MEPSDVINSKTINYQNSNIEIKCYKSSMLISYIDLNYNNSTYKKFSHLFPFEELLQNNIFFQVYQSIEDIYYFVLDKINKKHFSVSKNGNHLDFEINIDTYGCTNPKFKLIENEPETNKIVDKLFDSFRNIEKENKELKEKIIKLENNINNLENMYKKLNSELKLINNQLNEKNELNNKEYTPKILSSNKEDLFFKDSTILSIDEKNVISNWFNNNFNFKMIYKAKRDGDTAEAFHNKCDGKKNNIIIIQIQNGIKFGGYTSKSWEGEEYKEDSEAFVFSINKKKKYPIKENYNFYKNAIYCNPDHGPRFGGGREIFILDNCCKTNQNECNSPDSYQTNSKSELTFGLEKFQVFFFFFFQIE